MVRIKVAGSCVSIGLLFKNMLQETGVVPSRGTLYRIDLRD